MKWILFLVEQIKVSHALSIALYYIIFSENSHKGRKENSMVMVLHASLGMCVLDCTPPPLTRALKPYLGRSDKIRRFHFVSIF